MPHHHPRAYAHSIVVANQHPYPTDAHTTNRSKYRLGLSHFGARQCPKLLTISAALSAASPRARASRGARAIAAHAGASGNQLVYTSGRQIDGGITYASRASSSSSLASSRASSHSRRFSRSSASFDDRAPSPPSLFRAVARRAGDDGGVED
jgi:hypothetical protein